MLDTGWLRETDIPSIELRVDGVHFYNGTHLIRYVQDAFSTDLFIFAGVGDEGVIIPKVVVTSAGLAPV